MCVHRTDFPSAAVLQSGGGFQSQEDIFEHLFGAGGAGAGANPFADLFRQAAARGQDVHASMR